MRDSEWIGQWRQTLASKLHMKLRVSSFDQISRKQIRFSEIEASLKAAYDRSPKYW